MTNLTENGKKMTVKTGRVQPPPGTEETYAPLTDIYELEDGALVLDAEVPGASGESVDIQVDKGVLTIRAQAKVAEPGNDYTATYRGFTGGQYYRAFALSDEIDRERIEASLNDGLLTIRLPKAPATKTRKILVKS